jgi:hypothetical protein
MPVTLEELHRFHRFAEEKLGNGGSDLTLYGLVDLWLIAQPSPERLHDDVQAVKAALRDLDAGDRGVPLEEHLQEMREKYGAAEE